MYKRIDVVEHEEIDGFSYENQEGIVECVCLGNGAVVELLCDGNKLNEIFTNDIPKLILALQAAYDQLIKEGN